MIEFDLLNFWCETLKKSNPKISLRQIRKVHHKYKGIFSNVLTYRASQPSTRYLGFSLNNSIAISSVFQRNKQSFWGVCLHLEWRYNQMSLSEIMRRHRSSRFVRCSSDSTSSSNSAKNPPKNELTTWNTLQILYCTTLVLQNSSKISSHNQLHVGIEIVVLRLQGNYPFDMHHDLPLSSDYI